MIIGKCPVCGADMRVGSYMTRAELFRQMSDEEMAEYIDLHTSEAMWCKSPPEDCPPHEECVRCILDWLKEEVSE